MVFECSIFFRRAACLLRIRVQPFLGEKDGKTAEIKGIGKETGGITQALSDKETPMGGRAGEGLMTVFMR